MVVTGGGSTWGAGVHRCWCEIEGDAGRTEDEERSRETQELKMDEKDYSQVVMRVWRNFIAAQTPKNKRIPVGFTIASLFLFLLGTDGLALFLVRF